MISFEDRVKHIKKGSRKGKFILYWMQGAFRTSYNHTLEFGIYLSQKYDLPLLTLAVVNFKYPEANYRTFKFFMDGLNDVKNGLNERGLAFHLRLGDFTEILPEYFENSFIIATEKAYLPDIRWVKNNVYEGYDGDIFEVDTNLLVPVEIGSPKMEYGAYTIRPKLEKIKDIYLKDFTEYTYKNIFLEQRLDVDLEDYETLLKESCEYVPGVILKGGYSSAKNELKRFVDEKYQNYQDDRNDPVKMTESFMSFYLHFGHISTVEILKSLPEDTVNYPAYYEQVVVRRELAHNLAFHSQNFDKFDTYLPKWAKDTLSEHFYDRRDYIYNLQEFETAGTHDKYWNAAQNELVTSGKIHNYMRMYWGKKIIEWTENCQMAYKIMVYLNNKYSVDGRDPNSYTGILWCFGMHDRPFFERGIFGKVRYMAESGLKRKFDIDKYVDKWRSSC